MFQIFSENVFFYISIFMKTGTFFHSISKILRFKGVQRRLCGVHIVLFLALVEPGKLGNQPGITVNC